MDKETIETYDKDAESITKLHSTLIPSRVYELILRNFIQGGVTADIGCGTGRDTHWLTQNGYPKIGIDASEQMLLHAKSLFPQDNFFLDDLPELNKLSTRKFQNILCSAVLMHLSTIDFNVVCNRLLNLLTLDGRLIISFRGTTAINKREGNKLYETITVESFLDIFRQGGCTIVINENELDTTRNLTWHNFVIKK
jgi:2-polyprenyl-3-methyl-5-hydroxy-6-metoxy-1,4-benzoquinol methylase